MKNKLRLAFVALLPLIVITYATGASAEKTLFQVKVSISHNNNTLKNTVESYIKRELRHLGDVNIVTTGPSFEISIIAMKPADGQYVLSAELLAYPRLARFKDMFIPTPNNEPTKFIQAFIFDREIKEAVDSTLYIGNDLNLETACKEIVASLDATLLEAGRSNP